MAVSALVLQEILNYSVIEMSMHSKYNQGSCISTASQYYTVIHCHAYFCATL